MRNISIVIEYLLRYHDKGVNQIYNVADSNIYTFQKLVEMQKKYLDQKELLYFQSFFFLVFMSLGD